MSGMPIAKQHKIVHELVERYKFETSSIYNYKKEVDNKIFWINLITEVVTYFNVTITQRLKFPENIIFRKSIQELQETCFQDLLNPTENEITLFELQYGFKWPLTGETNETS